MARGIAQTAWGPVIQTSATIVNANHVLVTDRPAMSRSGSAGSSTKRRSWRPRTNAPAAGTREIANARSASVDPLSPKVFTGENGLAVHVPGKEPLNAARSHERGRNRPLSELCVNVRFVMSHGYRYLSTTS